MKNTKLLIELIDISFKLLILAIVLFGVFLLADPVSTEIKINKDGVNNNIFWLSVFIDFIQWIIFLVGIYFLRKVARNLLQEKPFTVPVIHNLKKSGISMVAAGLLHIFNSFGRFAYKLLNGELAFGFEMESLLPIFIIIVGLFFIIQSRALLLAKNNKEELELVV